MRMHLTWLDRYECDYVNKCLRLVEMRPMLSFWPTEGARPDSIYLGPCLMFWNGIVGLA